MNEVGRSSPLISPFVDLSFSAFDQSPTGVSSPSVQGLSPSGQSGMRETDHFLPTMLLH